MAYFLPISWLIYHFLSQCYLLVIVTLRTKILIGYKRDACLSYDAYYLALIALKWTYGVADYSRVDGGATIFLIIRVCFLEYLIPPEFVLGWTSYLNRSSAWHWSESRHFPIVRPFTSGIVNIDFKSTHKRHKITWNLNISENLSESRDIDRKALFCDRIFSSVTWRYLNNKNGKAKEPPLPTARWRLWCQ